MTMTPEQLLQAVRGKDPLRGLCASKQISPEGCDWLKSAADPFHDLKLTDLRGYPDVNTESTVVVKVRQAFELSAPDAVKQSQSNWDCHMVLSPVDWAKPTATVVGPNGDTGYNVSGRFYPMGTTGLPAGVVCNAGVGSGAPATQTGTTARMDGLVINSVPAAPDNGGDHTFTPGHMPQSQTAPGYKVDQINLDNYLDFDDTDLGAYRLIYSGFEVVNTTAQIYKQGAVTVYNYGQSYETSQAHSYWDSTSAAVDTQTVGTNTFRCPPNTIAEAKIMPASHTWPAQEGCYCTAKFQSDNPFQTATQRNYVFAQNNLSAGKASGYNYFDTDYVGGSILSPGLVGNFYNVTSEGSVESAAYNAAPACHFSRMSTVGAYFTGLSPQTTLFVTWRVGLERLPAANKPTFLALAQPSATYDPAVLTLYNIIANHLPPGCPQGWNDLGRWYRTIADVAQTVIPAAFPLVGTAQMMLRHMGAAKAAAGLPAVAKAAMAGLAYAKQQGQPHNGAATKAAIKLQSAARGKQQRLAVQNFGAPGQRRKRGVQSFSQMA